MFAPFAYERWYLFGTVVLLS